LREGEELSGEDIVPGFHCPLREIFPPKSPPAEAPAGAAAPDMTR
jgi:hypothetical protein